MLVKGATGIKVAAPTLSARRHALHWFFVKKSYIFICGPEQEYSTMTFTISSKESGVDLSHDWPQNIYSPWVNGDPPTPHPMILREWYHFVRGTLRNHISDVTRKKMGLTTNFGHFSKWPPQNLRFPISRKSLHVGSLPLYKLPIIVLALKYISLWHSNIASTNLQY